MQEVFDPAGRPITRKELRARQRESEELRRRDERLQEEARKKAAADRKKSKAS